MPRGKSKPVEQKIADKKELISALQTRIKSEQKELEELYKDKRNKDFEALEDILNTYNITPEDAAEILKSSISSDELQSA